LIHFYKRGRKIVHLNLEFERSLAVAEEKGSNVTTVRMNNKIERNKQIQQELEASWRRITARKLTSPVSQLKRDLLTVYLDQVVRQCQM